MEKETHLPSSGGKKGFNPPINKEKRNKDSQLTKVMQKINDLQMHIFRVKKDLSKLELDKGLGRKTYLIKIYRENLKQEESELERLKSEAGRIISGNN